MCVCMRVNLQCHTIATLSKLGHCVCSVFSVHVCKVCTLYVLYMHVSMVCVCVLCVRRVMVPAAIARQSVWRPALYSPSFSHSLKLAHTSLN